jgi:hypothetical protein
MTDSIAMVSVSGDASTKKYGMSRRIFTISNNNTTVTEASGYLNPASGNYAYASMLVDGSIPTAAPADLRNGTDLTLTEFKAQNSACYANWDFTSVWNMTSSGPNLKNMPLGGGTYGTATIDVVPWD